MDGGNGEATPLSPVHQRWLRAPALVQVLSKHVQRPYGDACNQCRPSGVRYRARSMASSVVREGPFIIIYPFSLLSSFQLLSLVSDLVLYASTSGTLSMSAMSDLILTPSAENPPKKTLCPLCPLCPYVPMPSMPLCPLCNPFKVCAGCIIPSSLLTWPEHSLFLLPTIVAPLDSVSL